MVGYNEEPGLNDQMIIFAKYNINALQANGSGFPTKVEKIDSGQKDYLANPASRSITNFMTENDYKFIVMFIITERNQNVGGKAPALFRKDDRMFYSVGENVQVQPFIVFINSQGYPIFFEISGVSYMLFENAKSGDFANHDFPIDE
jgi:hypothetical protein